MLLKIYLLSIITIIINFAFRYWVFVTAIPSGLLSQLAFPGCVVVVIVVVKIVAAKEAAAAAAVVVVVVNIRE